MQTRQRSLQKCVIPQTEVCRDMGKKIKAKFVRFSGPPSCFVCQTTGTPHRRRGSSASLSERTCRFKGFRTFYLHATDPNHIRLNEAVSVDFHDDSQLVVPELRLVYHEKRDLHNFKSTLAHLLAPILQAESVHASHPNIVRRHREAEVRATCDLCSTSLFASSWLCYNCGMDICCKCFIEREYDAQGCQLNAELANHGFCPVTRFEQAELQSALLDATLTANSSMEVQPPIPHEYAQWVLSRDVIKVPYDFPVETFGKLWSNGIPLVVLGVGSKLQLSWAPGYFQENYGRNKCEIENTSTGFRRTSTVAQFFKNFGKFTESRTVEKLKDWPPTANFEAVFPDLYKDFMAAVPMKEYTRADGPLNLASDFPSNTIYPDLGPKMYIALEDRDRQGSTRLHMDLSDAVNILVHASKSSTGEDGGARWHIFSREDTVRLSTILKSHQSYLAPGEGNPIHQQTINLTSHDLQDLKQRHDIVPYEILQRVGQAVFIPAGCAHQVGNESDCIKVACDFVSLSSVGICLELREQFRREKREDVLQIQAMLWYSWVSVCKSLTSQPQADYIELPNIPNSFDRDDFSGRPGLAGGRTPVSYCSMQSSDPVLFDAFAEPPDLEPQAHPSPLSLGGKIPEEPKHDRRREHDKASKRIREAKRKQAKAVRKAEHDERMAKLRYLYACPHPSCANSAKIFDGAEAYIHHISDRHDFRFSDLQVLINASETISELSRKVVELLGVTVSTDM